jgi:hypothetical protein
MLLKLDKNPRTHFCVQANSPHASAFILKIYLLVYSKFINQKGNSLLTKKFKNLKIIFKNIIVLKILIIQIRFFNLKKNQEDNIKLFKALCPTCKLYFKKYFILNTIY